MQYLGISDCNMEEGSFRADTNVSIKKKNSKTLGTKVELKNINSFKFITQAIEYEVERQILLLESGQKVTQETRLWDTKDQKTFSMRSKEEAADYRYFPEPDLPPVCIDERWIEQARAEMPELPFEKSERLQKKYALKTDDVDILIGDRELADYYEKAAKTQSSSTLINWVLRDLLGFVKEYKIALSDCKVTPEKLAQLVHLVDQGKINNRAGQEIFAVVAETGKDPQALVKELGLEQMGDSSELDAVVQKLIAENPTQVADYKAGKTKLMSFFVGQAMAQTKGRGNPQIFQELFKKYLEN